MTYVEKTAASAVDSGWLRSMVVGVCVVTRVL